MGGDVEVQLTVPRSSSANNGSVESRSLLRKYAASVKTGSQVSKGATVCRMRLTTLT
jgi:hypothetical protein